MDEASIRRRVVPHVRDAGDLVDRANKGQALAGCLQVRRLDDLAQARVNLMRIRQGQYGKPVAGIGMVMTWVWNMLGRDLLVSPPVGTGPNGVPIGMQVVANTFDDLTAFRLASAYARVAPPLFSGTAFADFRDDPSGVGSRAIK
jgi:Asp-tRNA(Asn)/Glu-tRNA(Gln) amidotransferase A subunit family amidase